MVDNVFVGRQEEIAALQASLDDTLAGRGRLVLLAGEPGIGKTRTADEIATYAHQHHVQALVGRCYEGDGAPAFWPWIQMMRAYVEVEKAVDYAIRAGQQATTILRRWEQAAQHFEAALATHVRMKARPLVAHTQHAYAAMLLARGQPGDLEKALILLARALETARELSMQRLAEAARTLQRQTWGMAPSVRQGSGHAMIVVLP